MGQRRLRFALALLAGVAISIPPWSPPATLASTDLVPASQAVAAAAVLQPGFRERVVWSGLTEPTAVRFASDGRAFVIEKSGLVKVFSSLDDTTPTTYSGLLPNVH